MTSGELFFQPRQQENDQDCLCGHYFSCSINMCRYFIHHFKISDPFAGMSVPTQKGNTAEPKKKR